MFERPAFGMRIMLWLVNTVICVSHPYKPKAYSNEMKYTAMTYLEKLFYTIL